MHRKTFMLYAVPSALAIIFLLTGIYLMPKINPYFSGAPQITRSEAKQIVDNFIQNTNSRSAIFRSIRRSAIKKPVARITD